MTAAGTLARPAQGGKTTITTKREHEEKYNDSNAASRQRNHAWATTPAGPALGETTTPRPCADQGVHAAGEDTRGTGTRKGTQDHTHDTPMRGDGGRERGDAAAAILTQPQHGHAQAEHTNTQPPLSQSAQQQTSSAGHKQPAADAKSRVPVVSVKPIYEKVTHRKQGFLAVLDELKRKGTAEKLVKRTANRKGIQGERRRGGTLWLKWRLGRAETAGRTGPRDAQRGRWRRRTRRRLRRAATGKGKSEEERETAHPGTAAQAKALTEENKAQTGTGASAEPADGATAARGEPLTGGSTAAEAAGADTTDQRQGAPPMPTTTPPPPLTQPGRERPHPHTACCTQTTGPLGRPSHTKAAVTRQENHESTHHRDTRKRSKPTSNHSTAPAPPEQRKKEAGPSQPPSSQPRYSP